MALFGRRSKHGCPVHTAEVVRHLPALVPLHDEDEPIEPSELVERVEVLDDGEDVPGHGWRVELSDEVGLLIGDPEDLAERLRQRRGVDSVVSLDRDVLAVKASMLCADGLRAAVIESIAAAHGLVEEA